MSNMIEDFKPILDMFKVTDSSNKAIKEYTKSLEEDLDVLIFHVSVYNALLEELLVECPYKRVKLDTVTSSTRELMQKKDKLNSYLEKYNDIILKFPIVDGMLE